MRHLLSVIILPVIFSASLFAQKVCLTFDGVDDYVEVPNAASIQVSGAVTLEAFIRAEGWAVQSAIISKVNDNGWVNGWELYVSNPSGEGNGNLIVVSTTGGTNAGGTSWNAVGLGEWVHVAAVYDLNEWRTYVNGVMTQGENASGSTEAALNPLRFGRRGGAGSNNNWFCGRIESVRISNIARYSGSFIPPTVFENDLNTAGLWLMDEASGSVVHDASGNGNDGTIYGAGWDTDGPAPVTIMSFEGRPCPGPEGVILNWRTASEVCNYGFTVQRRRGEEPDFCDVPGSFVAGKGTTVEVHDYTFTDTSIPGPGMYTYRLKQQDQDGVVHFSQAVLVEVVLTAVQVSAPRHFGLTQNYPNPFNPSTKIGLVLNERAWTVVKVFDMLGNDVATLMNELKEPGMYTLEFNGAGLSSGAYSCRLQSGGMVDHMRLLLVR
jgi:hypothetical protein